MSISISEKKSVDALILWASPRGGMFTTKEAEDYGVSRESLTYNTKTGKLVRLARGVYRSAALSSPPEEEIMVCVKLAGSGACAAGPTALTVYGLGHLAPSNVYIRKGPGARSVYIPKELKRHTVLLGYKIQPIHIRENVYVESVVGAIVTTVELEIFDPNQIGRVVKEADRSGMLETELFNQFVLSMPSPYAQEFTDILIRSLH